MNFSLDTNGSMMIQPQNISEDSARRKKAWETFTSTGKILEDAGLNSLLMASWMQCSLRMNPKGPLNWAYIILDGESGKVFIDPDKKLVNQYLIKAETLQEAKTKARLERATPAI